MSKRIITIDGPAGAGKTTVSKLLSKKLGCIYVDTGALYRGVAYEIGQQKIDWKKHVKALVHAYNCTVNDSTGYSPFFLMFGRHPRLPLDVKFGLQTQGQQPVSHSEYVKQLRDRLLEAYDIATRHSTQAQQNQKKLYDLHRRGATLQVGDRVLVRRMAFPGKHKLAGITSGTAWKGRRD